MAFDGYADADVTRAGAALTARPSGRAVRHASPDSRSSAIVHDLNNLLTVILAANEALAAALPQGSEGRELADLSQTAAEKGAVLLRRLLETAAPAAAPLDCAQALSEAARLARPLIPASARVSVAAPPAGLACRADPVELERALLNLCANAGRAIYADGWIELSADPLQLTGDGAASRGLKAGDYIRLSVRDNGCGMGPEVLARATEPHFTTCRARGGSGLGLCGVTAFVRAAGGALELASEPGRGTVVSLLLPRA